MLATLVLTALLAQATDFRIDPAGAEAGFDLKATAHTVHGTTARVSGDVRVEPQADGSYALSGKIEIGTASLATGNDRRDATMHDKSLLTATYPAIVFTPARFTPKGAAGTDGAVSGLLAGRITIRGQSRPQEITATLTRHGERIEAVGSFDVHWAEFGVPDPSFFVVRIESVAHAHFRATFAPVP